MRQNSTLLESKIDWAQITLAYLSLIVLGFVDNLRGPLVPELMRDLNLNHSEIGIFFGISSFMSFLSGFFIAKWIKKWGSQFIFRCGLLLMGLGPLLFFLASNPFFVFLGSVFLGMGFGLSTVLQNSMVSEASSPKSRKRLLSGLHSMYGLSSFLAPWAVTSLLGVSWGWRELFLLAAIPAFLVFAFSFKGFKLKKPGLEDAGGVVDAKSWFLALALGSYVVGEIIISTRLAVFIQQELSFSVIQAANELQYFFMFMLIGRLTFTVFHFSFRNSTLLICLYILNFIVVLAGVTSNLSLLKWSGLTMAPIYPLMIDYASEVFHNKLKSFLGLVQWMSSALIITMNLAFGILADFFGVKNAMALGIGFAGISLVLFLFFHLKLRVTSAE